MEKCIINGEPYIKLTPTKKYEYRLNRPSFSITDIKTNTEITINSTSDLNYLTPYTLDLLIILGFISSTPMIEYDNIGIYQIYCTANNICLIGSSTKKIITCKTMSEVEENFISLSDFIAKSLYIGRELISPSGNIELLYEFQSTYLLKVPNKEEYTFLNIDNPVLKTYQVGGILPTYYDKNTLYQQIMKEQIALNKSEGPKR